MVLRLFLLLTMRWLVLTSEIVKTFLTRDLVAHLHGVKIGRHLLQRFLVRRIDQPHHKKERHERGHEIRVGNFPKSTMTVLFVSASTPAN